MGDSFHRVLLPGNLPCRTTFTALVMAMGAATGSPATADHSAMRIGGRLFADGRFAQAVFAENRTSVNAPATMPPGRFVSCQTCHFSREVAAPASAGEGGTRAFCDFAARSPVPTRSDNRSTTPRNSPTLIDALAIPDGALLHFDSEFATAEQLVKGTFLGRNFGWLPDEQPEARRHFARVIREDDGTGELAGSCAHLPYAVLLCGTDASIPAALRLPESLRLDPEHASDERILLGCARLVVVFLRSLQFSRDAAGLHNGSPYDAFLELNRLPRAPESNQTPHEYARRLGEATAALRAPRFVDDSARRFRLHAQAFRFGELELRGMRIFFKGAIGTAQTGGAGNCAECHVPPHFTDFAFHNTGVAQDEFDAQHGAGKFAKLALPVLEARNADYDRWLQPTPQHPRAAGNLIAPVALDVPGRTDLGLWNVYGNPDLPAPQPALEKLLNPGGRLSPDEMLAGTVARFKTSSLRDLGQSEPYLHTGHAQTLEDVIAFYQRASDLAHAGQLRNAPPEFFAMRLESADIGPLAAFLRALNEDYDHIVP